MRVHQVNQFKISYSLKVNGIYLFSCKTDRSRNPDKVDIMFVIKVKF